jgi:SAM-dependent methyltransferase
LGGRVDEHSRVRDGDTETSIESFACALHGRCTSADTFDSKPDGLRACSSCADYLARDPLGPNSVQMLRQAENYLAAVPEYPKKRYQGRGIVIAGGGDRFLPALYVTVRALRHFGCCLPIQVWYLGRKKEMPAKYNSLLAPFQVECVDADKIRRHHPARRLGGWELKVFATIHCPFEDILFLDADCYPCRNPEFLFDLADYRALGAIFWPDGMISDLRLKWSCFGVPDPGHAGSIESGQFVLNKRLSWRPLNLAWFYNDHSDYYYRYCHGDKHTFEVAWARCACRFVMWERRALWVDVAYLHFGPDSLPLFVHRCRDKLRFESHSYVTPQNNTLPSFYSALPLERECWSWMSELARLTGHVVSNKGNTKLFLPSTTSASNRTSFTIGTLYTPEIASLGERTSKVIRAYAKRHGYQAIVATNPIDASRPATWSKLLLIEQYLTENPACAWLMWIDANAVITNPKQRLEDLIDDGVDFLACDDQPRSQVNTGVFLIRNCPSALEMLRRAYAKVTYIHHPWREAPAVVEALADCADTLRTRIVPRRTLNSCVDEHHPGDFIIHFAGCSPEATLAGVKKVMTSAKLSKGSFSPLPGPAKLAWSPATVSNALTFETAAIRNYWEHRLVREALAVAAACCPINVAYELAAGYGRMTRVLAEFANRVVAFERDRWLLARGRDLNPDLVFVHIRRLDTIPADDGSADFAMTFTVLQHLTDATCRDVVLELKRLVKRGHILLVEETDDTQANRDLPDDETGCCRYRSIARYQAELAPWRLVRTWPRRIEPPAHLSNVGTAMLFACEPS